MRSPGLSQPIPTRLALVLSSARSVPSFLGLVCLRMAQKLEPVVEEPEPAWIHTKGLSALLDAAKGLPKREPWDMADLDPEDAQTGLGKLLVEARKHRAAQHQ